VITDDNGSGKSTVLKSMALALLGPDKARYLHSSYDGWVTSGASGGSVSLEIRPDADIDKTRAGVPARHHRRDRARNVAAPSIRQLGEQELFPGVVK